MVAAVHEELVRPQVMTAVEDLTAREASGVLEVTGNPSGAFYLDGGRIAFARASWVPGLGARLRAARPALAGLGEPSSGQDADDAALAGFAVQRGYLTAAGLHELWQEIEEAVASVVDRTTLDDLRRRALDRRRAARPMYHI